MASTYSGNPGESPKDYLRFMMGDTDVSQPLLTDEEYYYIVDNNPNVNMQLAVACRQCAMCIGIKATKRSLGPQSEDNTARLNYFANMAEKYEKAARFSTTPPLPNYASEKVFTKGMMANET